MSLFEDKDCLDQNWTRQSSFCKTHDTTIKMSKDWRKDKSKFVSVSLSNVKLWFSICVWMLVACSLWLYSRDMVNCRTEKRTWTCWCCNRLLRGRIVVWRVNFPNEGGWANHLKTPAIRLPLTWTCGAFTRPRGLIKRTLECCSLLLHQRMIHCYLIETCVSSPYSFLWRV